MKQNGWELGEDDEELFELAMHPEQYRAYKSGKAKADFEADLAKRKAAKNAPAAGAEGPKSVTVQVNGVNYKVEIAYGDATPAAPAAGEQPLLSQHSLVVQLQPLQQAKARTSWLHWRVSSTS